MIILRVIKRALPMLLALMLALLASGCKCGKPEDNNEPSD